MLGDGCGGGWTLCPTPVLSCAGWHGHPAVGGGVMCLSRVVQRGGSVVCAGQFGVGPVEPLTVGKRAVGACATVWRSTEGQRMLWSQSGGLGGEKLRLLNEEAGGHEDMNPAVRVSQIVPSCAREQPPFGARGRLDGVCCWMQP